MISLKNMEYNNYSLRLNIKKSAKSSISFNSKYDQVDTSALRKYFNKVDAIAKYILNCCTQWKGINAGIIDINYDKIPCDGSIGLRIHNGNPCYLMTPLGRLSIMGNGEYPNCHSIKAATEKFAELKEKLGLVEILPKTFSVSGEQGPIFAITKDINGNSIPKLNPKGLSSDFYGNPSNSPRENAMIYNKVKPKTCWYQAS